MSTKKITKQIIQLAGQHIAMKHAAKTYKSTLKAEEIEWDEFDDDRDAIVDMQDKALRAVRDLVDHMDRMIEEYPYLGDRTSFGESARIIRQQCFTVLSEGTYMSRQDVDTALAAMDEYIENYDSWAQE